VCVDSVFLGRVNEHNGAAALQHAYAATIYQAHGSTVERAYVMVDPSMDRQEFYVATSRSTEQTYLYATPKVQIDREEIAPRRRICARALGTSPQRPSATAPRQPR
jgi:hypothetical protein